MQKLIDASIIQALKEDIEDSTGIIPIGDHSSLAAISLPKEGSAKLLVKADGVLAGVEVAKAVCRLVDEDMRFESILEDGTLIKNGDVAFKIYGDVKSILRAERVLLNYMQRMSGIATHTKLFVNALSGTHTKILDTRKTTPGFRLFEKWAVRIGGGFNHRIGLYDMIMLKDNHIDFCGGISKAIESVKKYQQENGLQLKVEIEARSLNDVHEIVAIGGVHRIMFDNFSPKNAAEAVKIVGNKFETEISGGVTLQNIDLFKNAGVDFISVGALTHSSSSLDLSLKAF